MAVIWEPRGGTPAAQAHWAAIREKMDRGGPRSVPVITRPVVTAPREDERGRLEWFVWNWLEHLDAT